MNKPILDGITVLDLTRVLCGPYATMHLGDMGAEVIKIETPNGGDETRPIKPVTDDGMSVYFAVLNRNKRSLTLNLKNPEAHKIFMELVKKADVIVENYRPGVVEKLGIDYESVKKVNPRIIYAAASGFGTTGMYSQRAGYDICAQAMAGQISITGDPDGAPVKAGTFVADHFAGLNLEIGIMGALYEREKTGEGQYLEVSLVDALLSTMPPSTLTHWVDGGVPKRYGNDDPGSAPIGVFPCKDGQFVFSTGNQKLWHLFCQHVLHDDELDQDPRFDTPAKRLEHKELMNKIASDWSSQHTVEECVDACIKAGLPTAPVWNIKQIHESEFFRDDRQMFVEVDFGREGRKIDTVAQPLRFNNHPRQLKYAPPMLGEHNEDILCNILGKTKEEVAALKEQGVI